MRKLNSAIVFTLLLAARSKVDVSPNEADAIRQQIANYTAALGAADTELAGRVWRNTAETSFIHPAGHAHGWEEIEGIYSFFGSSFTERKLTARDVVIHVNGDTAWAEFYWSFSAKAKDGSPVNTNGRETQVFAKSESRWQLVHAHYSGLPTPAPQ